MLTLQLLQVSMRYNTKLLADVFEVKALDLETLLRDLKKEKWHPFQHIPSTPTVSHESL